MKSQRFKPNACKCCLTPCEKGILVTRNELAVTIEDEETRKHIHLDPRDTKKLVKALLDVCDIDPKELLDD